MQGKQEITREYIDQIIEKQALDEVDNIFNNIEIQFFEELDKNDGKISLASQQNINLVINYLLKAWVDINYIEEIIPQNYLQKVLEDLKDVYTPEYDFFQRLLSAIFITNIAAILILVFFLIIFSKRIIQPIEKTTQHIKQLKIWKDFQVINYNKKDEIWLLVNAINGLNIKLHIGENIRNKLLWDISHELKTPITAIQLYLEGIKDGVINLNDKVLDSIIDEMQRLIKLVNTIMEFEKFESQNLKLHLKKENIYEITKNITEQYKEKLKVTHQNIILSWLKKNILTDKDSYIQIVQNIFSNFIKYAWEKTTLSIDFWVNTIVFKDNGAWVSKLELPYIKEKFYQGKNIKSGTIENRGIWVGLSVIEKLIKALWWEYEVSSQEWEFFQIKIITKTSH